MNFAVQAALLIGLVTVCSFTPGFFVVRRLRLGPLEKLGASIGLSLILLYLDTGIVYVMGGGPGGARLSALPFVLSSVACVILGVAAWKDIFRLIRSYRTKQTLCGFGFLLLWTLTILATIRVYSGALWAGDWLEHFQRTLFFLQRLPAKTVFTNVYSLPARPPFMNILGAFFLAQTQDRFEFFQIVFSFLNLLVFIPSCLLLPAISGVRRTRILPLVVLLALNPVVMQNATYSWTKSLTAFYIILGIAFYLSACRKSDTLRMVIAFVSLAAAILVHYSAGPYVVVITAHYLLTVFWKRRQRWKEFALISATCTAVLATYFGWAFTVYGEATIRSASNVTPGQHDQGNYVVNIPANLLDTIVPSVLGQRSMMMDSIKQSNSIGWLRDFAFSFYQPNMLFSMGLIGGPAVLWLLFRRFRRRPAKRSEGWTFWLAFVPFTVLVAMLIVGDRERLGMAHGVFLSLEIIGLTLLANAIGRRRTLAGLVLAGSLFDFSLGIFLHAHVQSLENGAGKTFFGDLVYANGMLRHAGPTADTLSDTAWQNWFGKHRLALCDRWLKELPERYATEKRFQIFWPSYRAQISDLRKEDGQWGGWYSRHDGEILYFGDHVAGTVGERVPLFVLVLLTAGLITLYIKQTPAAVQVRRKSQVRTKSRSS